MYKKGNWSGKEKSNSLRACQSKQQKRPEIEKPKIHENGGKWVRWGMNNYSNYHHHETEVHALEILNMSKTKLFFIK